MVEPPLNFLEVEMEELRRNAAVVVEPGLGVAPEPFNAVEVVTTNWVPLLFLHNDMRPTNGETRVCLPAVGEEETAWGRMASNEWEDVALASFRDREDADNTIALENAEDNDLASCTPATRATAPSTHHGFIQFQRTGEGRGCLDSFMVDGLAERAEDALNRGLREWCAEPESVRGNTQTEVLDELRSVRRDLPGSTGARPERVPAPNTPFPTVAESPKASAVTLSTVSPRHGTNSTRFRAVSFI